MARALTLLLLAGSSEARELARQLVADGHQVRVLKSETPRGAGEMPLPFDLLANPDAAALRPHLSDVDAVVDASHGFDDAMTQAGCQAAVVAGLPHIHLRRPAWGAEHPKWRMAADIPSALPDVPPRARVFSATGWASLPSYAGFPGARLLLRQTVRHDRPPPFDFVECVFGDPPFTEAQEHALFQALQVDLLICRNLGGRASRPKLDAAKALNLAVVLIDRPSLPPGVTSCETVDEVLAWVQRL